MPLPTDPQQPWPPKPWAPVWRDLRRHAAWYGGDPDDITRVEAARRPLASSQTPTSGLGGFWARRRSKLGAERQQYLHVPLAADIAAVSADLLFGDPISLEWPDDTDGDAQGQVEQWRAEGLDTRLLEGAEAVSALGGGFLQVGWDRDLSPDPILSVVHADAAVPEFRHGRLAAVTFWRTLASADDKVTFRHLERHEPGVILHGLYGGDGERLGPRIDLSRHPATGGLDDEVKLPDAMSKHLTVVYVPNVLPHRRHRSLPIGRSDYDGAETLLDALDETWTSWMRDIRLGVMRIIVADEFLRRRGRGKGAEFQVDDPIFTPLNLDPASREKASGIEPVKFELRVEEHERTAMALVERIVAGPYSPQTFGLRIEGRAESGTALNVRERRTVKTRGRKIGYWTPAVGQVIETMLAVDRYVLDGKAEPVRPRPSWPAPFEEDERERAETLDLLGRAKAMSVRTRVKMAQPELTEDELQEEVDRILQEESMGLPDPLEVGIA